MMFFVAYSLLGVSNYVTSVTMESEPTTNFADFVPIFPDLRDFPGDGVFFRIFYRNVALLRLRAQRG